MMDIKNFLVRCDYGIKNWSLETIAKLLFKRLGIKRNVKILVFRTGSIGDSICAFPALYSIRQNFPDQEIYLLTNPGARNVSMEYLLDKGLNMEIINYKSGPNIDLYKNLKEHKFDLFIELPQTFTPFLNSIRNMLIAKAIGAKYGFGWQVLATKIFKKNQEVNRRFYPVTDKLLWLLEKQGLKIFKNSYPLALTQDIYDEISKMLSEHGLNDKFRQIAIIAGAKRSTNRWPVEYFEEIIRHLTIKGYKILLVGGKDDLPQTRPLSLLPSTYDFSGKLTPLQSAALMSNCLFAISNDTGPMHLSYSVGTPVIAIFSARDYPTQWYPPADKKNVTLRSFDASCSPCLKEECPFDNLCLRQITPEKVIKEIDKLIEIN